VVTVQAAVGHVAQEVELTGSVVARHVAIVAAQQSGRVTSLGVREGDRVKAGDLLAVIDPSTYMAGAQSASGSSQAAQDTFQAAHADVIAAGATLAIARSAQQAAAAAAQNAHAHALRMVALYGQGAVSREVRDNAVTADDQTRAALASATADIARTSAVLAASQARAATAAGQAQAAHGQSQQAQVALEQTTIFAPFDGVVTKRWLDVGAYANPGSPVVTVESTDLVEIDLSVPEEDISAVAPGTRVQVIADALSVQPFAARVRALVPSASPNAHQFTAKLDVQPIPNLLPGMFVRTKVPARIVTGVAVPARSVITLAGQPGVYIVTNGQAAFAPVTVEATDGTMSIVTGVPAGVRIAIDSAGVRASDDVAANATGSVGQR
jgi:multidrug resistance efflux pump